MVRCLFFFVFLFSALFSFGFQAQSFVEAEWVSYAASEGSDTVVHENRKLTAVLLTLTLGMLGVHRLYLGTKPWVPAVYLLTFGGGFFILPLIDLVAILSSTDLSRFENNSSIFMWISPDRSAPADTP